MKADTEEEEVVADAAAVDTGAAAEAATAVRARCTRLSVLTAARSARFLSSRPREGRFTAGTASPSTRSSECWWFH